MRVLWVTNILMGDYAKRLTNKPMGGLWMDALFNQLNRDDDIFYTIATTQNVKKVSSETINDVVYYILPGGIPAKYKRSHNNAKSDWIEVFQDVKPDVIHIWGTEYSHSLPAVELAKEYNIQTVIYMQGIMKAIAKYASGNVSIGNMIKYTTLRDLLKFQPLFLQKKWFSKCAKTESKLLKKVDAIIVENLWAEAFCKSINDNLTIYKVPLNINEEFYKQNWSIQNMTPYTIICNASGPAYKGLHYLLESLRIVKIKYPNVKLFVPGRNIIVSKNSIRRQKKPGYWGYISDFIKKNNLDKNVVFTGYLTQKELAKRLSITNVFVLCSAIENHSSSLKEALTVGIPSIASEVGGVSEYLSFGVNGYSYRYGETDCVAHYICKIFKNESVAIKFSNTSIKKLNVTDDLLIVEKITSMYRDVVSNEN